MTKTKAHDIQTWPLSPLQEGLLYFTLELPEQRYYIEQVVLRLQDVSDHPQLVRAWQHAVQRHAILRSAVAWGPSGAPVQVIADKVAQPVTALDWSSASADQAVHRLDELLAQDRRNPLDILRPPPLRVALVKGPGGETTMVVTFHHLVLDGWSLVLVLKDVLAEYARPTSAPVVEAPPFGDYIRWLQAQDQARAEAFWSQHLRGLTPSPPFADMRRAGTADAAGDLPIEARRSISAGATHELARRLGLTPNTIAQAAWALLLARHGGARDVVFGQAVSDRAAAVPGIEAIVGPCISTLPTRVHVDPEATLASWLRELQQHHVQAREHAHCSLQQLARWADLPPGTPIFETLFGFEVSIAAALAEPAVACGIAVVDVRHLHRNNFSVGSLVESSADQLHVTIKCDPAQFAAAAAARIADEYVDLLDRIVRHADRPICLALAPPALVTATRLSRAEQEANGALWNQTREDFPRDACLHELFEARAAAAPSAPAILAGAEGIDYRTLNERANRLAHRLVALGARVGCHVALLLERSPEWATALVATLKTGAAYVPLDPSHPPSRVQFMLHDIERAILITHRTLRSKVEGACEHILELDEAEPTLAHESEHNLSASIPPESLSYVIYTSGTTGQPKGVMLDHVGRVNNFSDFNRRFAVGPADRILAVSSLSFDMSAYDVCGTLMAGAAIVLPIAAAERDPSEWLRLIERDRVTIWHSTPALLDLLIAECERRPPPAARTLRLVLLGGDWIPVTLPDRVRAVFPGAEVVSLGGATEASMDSTIYRIGAVDPAWNSIPYGHPMANQTAYILDEDLELTAPGVAGELHLGGVGLAWGYHRRPELTAERFIPHPLSDSPGARLYRTGDLARYDADGLIELLGRIDYQVKINGVRVELEEIEAVLRRHPDVAKAVVVARQHQGRNQLAAYVVPEAWSAATCFRNAYTLPGGVRIAQQNKNETDYLYHEIFEERTYMGPGIELREGACVFDVGANIGMFMLFIGEQVPDAKIYAFEPIPAIYANLAANAVSCPAEVRTFPIGLSDTERQETFTYYPRSSIMSGMAPYASGDAERAKTEQFLANAIDDGSSGADEILHHADEILAGRFEGQPVTCAVRRLSDVIREQGVSRIDLLKIDVERAELDVLRGIDDPDWPAIQQLVIEVHDRLEENRSRLEQVVTLLERHGFIAEIAEDHGMRGIGLYNVYARRPSAATVAAADTSAQASRPAPSRAALRKYLQQQLPPQLMPTEILLVPSLPVTANGKVDRWALSSSEAWSPVLTQAYVAPRNQVETVLEQIWSEVLRRSPIGVHENYFDLGGDSLQTLRIAARAREHGIQLTPLLCFEHPTIAALASAIARSETPSKGEMS